MELRYLLLCICVFVPLLVAQDDDGWPTVDYPVYIYVRNDDLDPCKYFFSRCILVNANRSMLDYDASLGLI